MTETSRPANTGLIIFQRISWLSCVIYFAIVTLLLLLKVSYAAEISRIGIVLILIAGICQLLVMAAGFKRAGNKKFTILSYALLIVIVSTAVISAFLL